jgi:molybdopterin-binding protein
VNSATLSLHAAEFVAADVHVEALACIRKGISMKISARNSYKGKITNLHEGPVSTEVTMEIAPSVEMVSVITTHSAKVLGLKVGMPAYAIVKAYDVIVGTD